MRIPLTLLALASCWLSTTAFDLKGRIQWNDLCPGIGDLGQAKVVLDNGIAHGGVTRDGGFVIPDVTPGTYILSVQAHDYAFDGVRVDVLDTDSLPEIRPYISGTPLSPPSPVSLPYPISLAARAKYEYFVDRESFNLLAMFKNPMMMIMVFTGVMMLAMPYLMKNMDPEVLQDFKERQARVGAIQSSLLSGDLKSGLNAIMDNAEDHKNAQAVTASSTAKPQSSSSVKNRGKNKKR